MLIIPIFKKKARKYKFLGVISLKQTNSLEREKH